MAQVSRKNIFRVLFILVVVIILLMCLTPTLEKDGAVHGVVKVRVISSTSGKSVEGAEVTLATYSISDQPKKKDVLMGNGFSTRTTDKNGFCHFEVSYPCGWKTSLIGPKIGNFSTRNYKLLVTSPGYIKFEAPLSSLVGGESHSLLRKRDFNISVLLQYSAIQENVKE